MKIAKIFRFAIMLLMAYSLTASAQDVGPKRQEFEPASGSGRVVLLISGHSGMGNYTSEARQIADAGFHVVLVDGNDFWIKDLHHAAEMVKEVITQAQASPHALPGKIGVVGYSLGGGVALVYAARMPELVATVVATYPMTSYIKDPSAFIAKTKVPVQIFAGTADTYKNCCLIEKARELADAAKTGSQPILALHEYKDVGHGFNFPTASRWDQAAGRDSMERTIALLKQALPT